MSSPLSKSCNNCIHQTSWLEKYASQTCIWSHPYQSPRVAGVLFRVTWPIIMRRVCSLGFNAVSFSQNCKCKLQMCKRPALSSPQMIFIFNFSFANVRLIDVIDIRRPVKKTRQNWLWNHEKLGKDRFFLWGCPMSIANLPKRNKMYVLCVRNEMLRKGLIDTWCTQEGGSTANFPNWCLNLLLLSINFWQKHEANYQKCS